MSQSSPKVFISYSWTSPEYQARVRGWAERLIADGIDVVFDLYDLKEGDDKFAFMERIVTDDTVSHVLAFCDKEYAEKADARKAGVGTESQIISKEIYERVTETKVIPVACELDEKGAPYLPAFFRSRIFVDFSSLEAENNNWEQLVRRLYGQPLYQRPSIGRAPAYITEDAALPLTVARLKYSTLQQAVHRQHPAVPAYRSDFLDACFEFADALRVREAPDGITFRDKIIADCGTLRQVRNAILDWVLLEAVATPQEEFAQTLVETLERLCELKSRPPDVKSWNEVWFEAHSIFVYETFLYAVAGLLKSAAYETLHEILSAHYLLPETAQYGEGKFKKFDCFRGYSTVLQDMSTDDGRRYLSPEAELIRRQADRTDIPFSAVMEAEAIVLLMSFLTPETYWYPGTILYVPSMAPLPFFVRATRRKDFRKLAAITGTSDVEQIREAVARGEESFSSQGGGYGFRLGFAHMMNVDKLDTLV